jgi:hypothetical protein
MKARGVLKFRELKVENFDLLILGLELFSEALDLISLVLILPDVVSFFILNLFCDFGKLVVSQSEGLNLTGEQEKLFLEMMDIFYFLLMLLSEFIFEL